MNIKKLEHFGFNIEYYENDMLGRDSIGAGKKWEPHILEFIKFYKKYFKLVNIIDVGANFGYHSLFFSKEVSKNVYAFEPQPQNIFLLNSNIDNNNITNVKIYPYAVSNNENQVYIPIISSNIKNANMGDITLEINKSDNNVKVNSILLDNMNLFEIDIIKIDVQGWELNVLNGAKKLIERDKPILIIEFEKNQLAKNNISCEFLANSIREMGYYIFLLDYEYPSDHICVHKDKLDIFVEVFNDKIKKNEKYNFINENIKYGVDKKIVIEYDHYK